MESNQTLNYGWTCPKCGRTYSPFTQMCYYCNDVSTTPVVNTSPSANDRMFHPVNIPDVHITPFTDTIPEPVDVRHEMHMEGYPTMPMDAL